MPNILPNELHQNPLVGFGVPAHASSIGEEMATILSGFLHNSLLGYYVVSQGLRKRKSMKPVVLFLVLFASVVFFQAQAQNTNTGNYLAERCRNWDTTDSGSYNSGYCIGFIIGVDAELDTCEGENVTRGQIVKVVVKYMDDHPEELDQNAATIVRRSLEKVFPCKK